MFELGRFPNSALSGSVVALGREKSPAPMTLNEKVIGYFEQLRAPVFRYLLRKTHDPGRAEDLTQETFLRLCRHLREDRPLDNPKAWLFTVAANLAVDTNRNEQNIADLDEHTWKEIEDSRSGVESDPETLLLQNERLDRLQIAVLNLRAEGLRYRKIAELMGISMSTVADAVRRATVKLAREVDSEVSA
jgi:RNA polymerase sigma-70 factor (ECF subfamily)